MSQTQQVNSPPSRAQCPHKHLLAYQLSEADQSDFCRRLNEVLGQAPGKLDNSEFNLKFLTPSLRGQRAKSMLTTTRASNNVQSTTSGKGRFQDWSPDEQPDYCEEGDSTSKRRSTTRRKHKNKMMAPSVFHNCEECGSFYISDEIVAVKPRQYCFRAEIVPAQLVCTFFELQQAKEPVAERDDLDSLFGQELYLSTRPSVLHTCEETLAKELSFSREVAFVFLVVNAGDIVIEGVFVWIQGRKRIIDGIYKMGVKFRQARETIHIAIEIIDRFYLTLSQEMTAKSFKKKLMQPSAVILHQLTALLIASKFDEMDDNITAIRDLREYVHKQLAHQLRRDNSLVPSFNQIVECERKLLIHFNWDLKFVLPLHILRAFLANGVLFSNEFAELATTMSSKDLQKIKADWSRSITTESLSISDLIVSKGNVTFRSESSSDIAASIIYLARKNILEADSPTGQPQVPHIWPQELVMITRCTEAQAKRILIDVLKSNEGTKAAAPANYTRTRAKNLKSDSVRSPHQASASCAKSTEQSSNCKTNRLSHAPTMPSIGAKGINSEHRVLERLSGHNDRRFHVDSSEQMLKSSALVEQSIETTSVALENPLANYASGALPTRSVRANTLQANIKSSVEMLGKANSNNASAIFVPVKQNSLEAESTALGTAAPKTQSQRHLFAPQGHLHVHSSASQESFEVRTTHLHQDRRPGSKQRVFSTLSDESSSAYGSAAFLKQEGCPQPSVNTIAPHKLPVLSLAGHNKRVGQSCEQIKERSALLANSSEFKDHVEGSLGQSALQSIAKQSSRSPEDQVAPSCVPISSSARPRNELGFAEEDMAGEAPIRLTERVQQEESHFASERANQDSQRGPKEGTENKIEKQSSLHSKTSQQLKARNKRPLVKSKYIEVKRAQIARNEQAKAKQAPKEKKTSQNKLVLQGDLQAPSPSQLMVTQQPRQALTTKNSQANHKPLSQKSSLLELPMHKGTEQSTVADSSHLMHVPPSLAKQGSALTAQSNEYFSVRPKMLEHVNQAAMQKEILRAASIEYESRLTHASDHAKPSLRSGPHHSSTLEVAPHYNHFGNNGQGLGISKNGKRKARATVIGNPGEITSTSAQQLSASQVSFLKVQKADKGQTRTIGPHSVVHREGSTSNGQITQVVDPTTDVGSEYIFESSVGSQNPRDLMKGSDGSRTRPQILPNIDLKTQSLSTQAGSQNDFSSAVERFQVPSTKVSSNKGNTHQQIKMLSKGVSGHQAINHRVKKESISQSSSQPAISGQAQYPGPKRHNILPVSEDQIAPGSLSKVKSSMFGTQSHATASSVHLSSFVSKSGQCAPAQPQQHSQSQYQSSKGFLRKGPNFNQMKTIVTPDQHIESSIAKPKEHHKSGRFKSDSQKPEGRTVSQASMGGPGPNYAGSLAQNGRVINNKRNSSNQRLQNHLQTKATLSGNTQLLAATQRFMTSGVTSQTHVNSTTLQKLAVDEAMANLKQHQSSVHAAPVNTGGLTSATGTPSSSSKVLPRSKGNQSGQGIHTRQVSGSSRKSSQCSILPMGQPTNPGVHRNHGQTLVSSLKGANASQKVGQRLLTVENNKTSSFLANQQHGVGQQKGLFSGRSLENIRMMSKQGIAGSATQETLRLHSIVSTNQQDSKH